MKIPDEFMKFSDRFYLGMLGDYPADEAMARYVKEPLDPREREVVKNYLDELLSGKYSEKQLLALWELTMADSVPFRVGEGTFREFLEMVRGWFDDAGPSPNG